MTASIDFSNNANRSLQLLMPSNGDILRYASGAWANGKIDLANFTSGIIATTLADNSDLKLPTQKAVKTAVDAVSASIVPFTPTAGMILRVVSVTKSDPWVATPGLNTWVDITGMAATITPSSTANKILVLVSLQICRGAQSMLITRLIRGSTPICVGDTAGNRPLASASTTGGNNDYTPQASVVTYLDSPTSTSATTYKMQAQSLFVNDGIWVNRTPGDGNDVNHARFASTITLMEVKG